MTQIDDARFGIDAGNDAFHDADEGVFVAEIGGQRDDHGLHRYWARNLTEKHSTLKLFPPPLRANAPDRWCRRSAVDWKSRKSTAAKDENVHPHIVIQTCQYVGWKENP
jgi:hypothetical protein